MNTFIFKAEKREQFGTSNSRRLRKKNLIPAVVYSSKKEAFGITLDANNVAKLMSNESVFSSIVDVELFNGKDSKKFPTLIKAIQYHPFKGNVTHIDFLLVDTLSQITTNIPIRFIGQDQCVGVKLGGVFSENVFNIEVSCLPKDLPKFISVDVSALDIDDNILLSAIKVPKGVEFVDLSRGEESIDYLICSVNPMREIEEENDADLDSAETDESEEELTEEEKEKS